MKDTKSRAWKYALYRMMIADQEKETPKHRPPSGNTGCSCLVGFWLLAMIAMIRYIIWG